MFPTKIAGFGPGRLNMILVLDLFISKPIVNKEFPAIRINLSTKHECDMRRILTLTPISFQLNDFVMCSSKLVNSLGEMVMMKTSN